MKFQNGKIRFEAIEVFLVLVSFSISLLFALPSFGISILATIGFWYLLYESELKTTRLMFQIADDYHKKVKAEVERLAPLTSYDEYLPNRDRLLLQEPLHALEMEISKLPEKYFELWLPMREDIGTCLKFLYNYNDKYVDIERERHQDFFNGAAYHNGNEFNEEQIQAILTNDYNNLIVAGPGAGKTRVLTSRVAFFTIRKNMPEDRILVLAYNKSAAEEVRQRLLNRFGIKLVDVNTFHSLGFRILRNAGLITTRNAVETQSEHVLKRITNDILNSDNEFRSRFQQYLTFWLAKGKNMHDDQNVDEKLKEKELESYTAIDGTSVKSLAERDIANFFIRHGIRYAYEEQVDWCDEDVSEKKRTYCPDFYLPDFDVYIEHWSVNADGDTPSFFTSEGSINYKRNMAWKRGQFEKYEKTLWETNHTMFVKGQLQSELSTRLSEIGVAPERVSHSEILSKAGLDKNATDVVTNAITSAVKASKVYGFSPSSLAEKIRDLDSREKQAHREAEFILDMVLPVFEAYEDHLKEKNKIDYEDMINKAVGVLENLQDETTDNSILEPYDMIMVDEFQDISYQRLKLLDNLQRINPRSKLFCVGDDWQAIYGFAGSSAQYMIKFDRYFPSPERVDLVQNYRNPSDILDFASDVIQKCKSKLDKELIPRDMQEKETMNPNLVFTRIATSNEFDFRYKQNEAVIEHIRNLLKDSVRPSEILVLSRFKFGYADLKEKCQEASDIPVELVREGTAVKEGIRFMSIHKSKGLEADYVILLNVFEGLFGFPPDFNKDFEFQIINLDLPDSMDEERRLLFVASTRAKKQCMVFTMKQRESSFLKNNEFYRRHFNKKIKSTFIGEIVQKTEKAYLFMAHLSPSLRPTFWAPKSVSHISPLNDGSSLSEIHLDGWWYEKEGEKINDGL